MCEVQESPYLCAALRIDFVKLELLLTSLLDDHHFLVVGFLHTGAGGRGPPAAAEHPDVSLQLQQFVVQTLPLHRLLPVERSQLLHLTGCLHLHQGQPPSSTFQLLQLVLHVRQRLLNRGAKLLVGDVQLTGQTAHLTELAGLHGGLCDGLDRQYSGSPPVREGSDFLSLLLLIGLELGQPEVQVLNDVAEVTYLPGQVGVLLKEVVQLLLSALELLPQILDDPVSLQEGPVGLKQA